MGIHMKSVALHNLGCKVNAYETEVMRQRLQEKGYHIVPFGEKADIYIVNTCTVTNIADRKSRQMLHRARQLNPEAVVVAVGCYVQTGREALERDECVDLCVGNNRKKDIAEILEEYLAGRRTCDAVLPDIGKVCDYEDMKLRQTAEHTRAYIKIQDGCNQFCSYCAIPYARGRVRSRRAEDILSEVRGLAETGYREIVLTGIHISSYGTDFDDGAWRQGKSVKTCEDGRLRYTGQGRLVELVERIHEIPGLERIRLGSLEPRIITRESAGRLAALPKLCPHFHLSLQSGCDETLKRMNRHYTTGQYYESVEILREEFAGRDGGGQGRRFEENALSGPAITTDVIVGFPGETEEEFAQTREFLEKVRFYEMHVFKYSRREGTAAARMPDQVPERVRTARSNELLAMERRQSAEFRRKYIGREAEVLLEETAEIGGSLWSIGHTKDYVKVAVKAEEPYRLNTVVKVRVKGFLTEEILV